MIITIYNKYSGKIIKTLNGGKDIINYVGKNEAYIEGDYLKSGKIVGGVFYPKEYLYSQYKIDNPKQAVNYAALGKDTCLKALQNTGLTKQGAEEYIKDNYKLFREKIYPNFKEYIDAQVKINSSNLDIQKQGKKQLKKYLEDCQNVKNLFPKI